MEGHDDGLFAGRLAWYMIFLGMWVVVFGISLSCGAQWLSIASLVPCAVLTALAVASMRPGPVEGRVRIRRQLALALDDEWVNAKVMDKDGLYVGYVASIYSQARPDGSGCDIVVTIRGFDDAHNVGEVRTAERLTKDPPDPAPPATDPRGTP
jgi:hypothetical protein